MTCEDKRKKQPCNHGMFRQGGLMIPANIKKDEITYIGHKVRSKPNEYNAVFVEIRPNTETSNGDSGWMISILGSPIFISEEDMSGHFEIIREMDVPFEDEIPSGERNCHKKKDI